MRVSEYYKIERKQSSLDFVDVDVRGDTALFVDPRAIQLLRSEWGDECVFLIQDFFKTVLNLIKKNQDDKAQSLLRVLREPNETHLGLSTDKACGRALGFISATKVWNELTKSEAAKSGLLEDLEDTILMIEGISADIVSDMSINIIRHPLINYTQEICRKFNIPMEEQVDSGPLWNPEKREWYSKYVELPVTDFGKLLLVPKVIVRRRMDYDASEYYNHYILEHLREVELNANTELVILLKDGRRRVNKKDLKEKYGQGKHVIIKETLKNPDLLEKYRAQKSNYIKPPLSHVELAEIEETDLPDWNSLLEGVTNIKPGKEQFSKYENAIEKLLSALFYPSLANPSAQQKIHDGRKRIDITYTNVANDGFFGWLAKHYTAPHVFVECKNYGTEIGNPELDQLSGRFSPSRGKFGILICREFKDKDLFITRCIDTAKDNRGYIIPLDDQDLRILVDTKDNDFGLLKDLFDKLIM